MEDLSVEANKALKGTVKKIQEQGGDGGLKKTSSPDSKRGAMRPADG